MHTHLKPEAVAMPPSLDEHTITATYMKTEENRFLLPVLILLLNGFLIFRFVFEFVSFFPY